MARYNPNRLLAGMAFSFLIGVALASCSSPGISIIQTSPAVTSVQPIPKELASATTQSARERIPTAILSPSKTATAPLTPTPATMSVPTAAKETTAPISRNAFIEPGVYSSLEQGYYILYDGRGRIHALSMDGKVDRVLTTFWDLRMEVIGSDGKRLAVYQHPSNQIFIYNIEDSSTKVIEYPEDCRPFQISNNLHWQSLLCSEGKEIQIRSLVDTQRPPLKIANLKEGQVYQSLSWAPENNWLAASLWEAVPGDGNDQARWAFFDTSCLDQAENCSLEENGPFQPGGEEVEWQYWTSWWPDGLKLAFPSHSSFPPVWTFDVATRTFSKIPAISSDPSNGTIQGLAISPDGKTIAYTQQGKIYLAPALSTGVAKKIMEEGETEKVVIGWLSTYPSPVFKIGAELAVSGAGDKLNMRQSPAKNAVVIHLLRTGDPVTLVEGPVEADGARWWKLKTSAGVEGWSMERETWFYGVH